MARKTRGSKSEKKEVRGRWRMRSEAQPLNHSRRREVLNIYLTDCDEVIVDKELYDKTNDLFKNKKSFGKLCKDTQTLHPGL